MTTCTSPFCPREAESERDSPAATLRGAPPTIRYGNAAPPDVLRERGAPEDPVLHRRRNPIFCGKKCLIPQSLFCTKYHLKNLQKIQNSLLTARGNFVILIKRVGEICPKHVCDEAGDCSEEEVTSVEYVRYRLPWRYTIGRLRFSERQTEQCVYRLHGKETGQCGGSESCDPDKPAGLFFGKSLIRTVWWKENFIRTTPKPAEPNAAEYRTNLEEKHTWQPQRNRSASVSRPMIIS